MKKSNLALAVLCTMATCSWAQTSVTVYGVMDLGVVSEGGGPGGSVLKLSSGVSAGSRLGFRGSEDLGGGLSAKFVIESGIAADTGGLNQGGLTFGRQAFVGLDGGFGSITAGRQYAPHFLAVDDIDPFGTGLAGNSTNLLGTTARMSNALIYTTPSVGGFNGQLAYGFGEIAGDASANRQMGLRLGYSAGPFSGGLAHHHTNDPSGTTAAKNTLISAKYDFNFGWVSLGYNVNDGAPGNDSRDVLVGLSVPAGTGTIMASYVRKDDRSALNRDAAQIGIGYIHNVSKRTALYTSYARIDNDNGAMYTVGNAIEAGSGNRAFNFGVRHRF
ncbi:porin [Noviherbaspirillum saxi]|uniref:Porin n=1 Tax=Noviherbaspirillum saxi TaxID=2320863 RepID=A0A3A3FJZ0_9BURK|nr:porin [Noviherbaspirillum saxi]RJF95514.1 porin [Noviherbaspirillum saxi]